MNKNKTASLIAFLGVFVLLGYQNCSKVGVEDASASAKVTGDSPLIDSHGDETPPVDVGGPASDPADHSNGNPDNPGSPSNPGDSNHPGPVTDQPNNPPPTIPGKDPQGPSDVLNPTPPSPPTNDLSDDDVLKLNCKNLLELEGDDGLDRNAVNDLVLKKSGPKVVPPVRNLTMLGVSGSTIVQSALKVLSVDHLSGHLVMRADQVGTLSGVSGMLCLNANHVDSLENSSHGGAHIKAKTIDNLSNHGGNLHIYGATVTKLLKTSGDICLHDGAKILNMDQDSAKAVKENCK
jgi:hypothetical protein